MTTVEEIMAEALKKAGDERGPPRLRQDPHGGLSIAPGLRQEPSPQPAGIRLTPEQLRARRSRSIAIALALGAFVAVIFAVTIVRLGSNALSVPDTMRPVQTTK
jgi:hypothetical protein